MVKRWSFFRLSEGAVGILWAFSSIRWGGERGLTKPSEFGSRDDGMFAVITYMCGVRGFYFLFGETTVTIECHGMYRYTEDDGGQTRERWRT